MSYEIFMQSKRVITDLQEILTYAIEHEHFTADVTLGEVEGLELYTYFDSDYIIEYRTAIMEYSLTLGSIEYTNSELYVLESILFEHVYGYPIEEPDDVTFRAEGMDRRLELTDLKATIMGLLHETDDKTLAVKFYSSGEEIQSLTMLVREAREFDILEKCVYWNLEYLTETHGDVQFAVINKG